MTIINIDPTVLFGDYTIYVVFIMLFLFARYTYKIFINLLDLDEPKESKPIKFPKLPIPTIGRKKNEK